MEKLITFEKLANFAYTSLDIVARPIRGIVVDFFGLGYNKMIKAPLEENKYYLRAERFAPQGILYVFPYNNPWSWMNRQAVDYTDEVLDTIIEGLGLDENIPLVYTGGSMGGQSCLVYTRYAKRVPVATVANCPVCDSVFHYTERPDLPRTFYSSLYNMDTTLDEALRTLSPLHLVDGMPRSTKYFVYHCTADRSVSFERHSIPFCREMEKEHDISLTLVEERGHCDLGDEVYEEFYSRISDSILKK